MVAPYSSFEAWAYDRFIAPAVAGFHDAALAVFGKDLPARARVLDVGCGGGQNILNLAERFPDWTFTGLDLAPGQVGRAQRRSRSYGDRVTFVQGSALDLPFGDGEFDIVLSIASIKHWPDQPLGLHEMHRVLKPGGHLLVIEADRGCKLDDCRRFIAAWPIPRPLQPWAVMAFRTYVAGQALDLDDARRLLAPLKLNGAYVERLPNLPALAFGGRKPVAGKASARKRG